MKQTTVERYHTNGLQAAIEAQYKTATFDQRNGQLLVTLEKAEGQFYTFKQWLNANCTHKPTSISPRERIYRLTETEPFTLAAIQQCTLSAKSKRPTLIIHIKSSLTLA